jgi:hypothetical protein
MVAFVKSHNQEDTIDDSEKTRQVTRSELQATIREKYREAGWTASVYSVYLILLQ